MKNISVIIESAGKLNVVDTPVSEPGAEQLLLRVHYTALCGSDVKLYKGTYLAPHSYSIIMGHEWVGEVIKAGAGVSDSWSVGDIVTGDCSIYCNTCENCERNYKNHCLSVGKRGITLDGGCSQYIIVNQQHIYKCPKLPDIKALALVEPLAVTVEAVVNRIPRNEIKKVRSALIIGSGGIGAMAVFLLCDEGIPHIVVADTVPEKLAIVDSFRFGNVKTIVTDLRDGAISNYDGFDLIIEAAGSRFALQKAVELAKPCGKIVCVGHQKKVDLDFSLVMKKSLMIIASIGSTGGFPRAIEIVEKNAVNIEKLITTIIPLSDVKQFFDRGLGSGKDVKIVIDMK